jgi:hypothetical protein
MVRGCDARSDGTPRPYRLRETARYWIDERGCKYDKRSGRNPGAWPMYKVLLDTIKPLETP